MVAAYGRNPTPELVKVLIFHGADVNARDEFGMTALMWAAKWGYPTPELLKTLVSHGADVNIRNEFGRTALEECVFTWPFSMSTTRNIVSFLSYGAVPSCTPEDFNAKLKKKNGISAAKRTAYALLLASSMHPERDEAFDALIAKNRSRAVNLILPCMTDASPSLRNGFIGVLSTGTGRSSALFLSPENVPYMVSILLDTLDSDPELAVNFIQKRVKKKLEVWFRDKVPGMEKLVSRLVPYLKQNKSIEKGEPMTCIEF